MISYKTRKRLLFSTYMLESVFIEIDKSIFKSKRNVIRGEYIGHRRQIKIHFIQKF